MHLTPKAFDLLKLLIDAAPSVVSKDDIHARLWPNQVVSDATLVGLIKELRRACKDRDAEFSPIRTVHRVGYALDCDLEPLAASEKAAGLLFIGSRCWKLIEGANSIGRNADCEVWIDHATVSREHARIVIESGRATLEDLGSKNGTRINGKPLIGSCELSDGDGVQFGEVDVLYHRAKSSKLTETQVTRADL